MRVSLCGNKCAGKEKAMPANAPENTGTFNKCCRCTFHIKFNTVAHV